MPEHSALPQESFVRLDGKEYKVLSFFEGKETASKLLCDLAVSRILYESPRLPEAAQTQK